MADELDAYDFALPPEQIAQQPTPERDGARLLVLDRSDGHLAHRRVRELPDELGPGDLLVVNATRVVPARLRGRKTTGGAAEALLLEPEAGGYRALVRAPGRLRPGLKLVLGGLDAEVTAVSPDGEAQLVFAGGADPYAVGETPLPPYIRRGAADPADAERYQTVFARVPGSVAAPTAGLHLSSALLDAAREAGAEVAEVILHVGLGTFRPLRPEDLARGQLHEERYALPEATADAVARARERGGRVVAIGTTTTRVLETCARDDRSVEPGAGTTGLFLRPASPDARALPFRCVDALLTNFHLPRSSLLMLVCAFAGRRRVLDAYAEAVRAGYRFYSYGDAMLVA